MNDTVIENSADSDAPTAPAEKMVPQSEVNRAIGHAKAVAEEKGRRAAQEEYERRLTELQKTAPNTEVANHPELDADAIYQQIAERITHDLQRKHLEDTTRQVAQTYLSKMQQGAENYDDFHEVTNNFEAEAYPQLVYLVAGMDNAADIIYELAKNPHKLVTFDALAQRSPRHAHSELKKLSDSIMLNRKALADAEGQTTAEPLDRLQSTRASGSNGKLSVSDLRKQDWLRG